MNLAEQRGINRIEKAKRTPQCQGAHFVFAFSDAGKTSTQRYILKLPFKKLLADVNIIIHKMPRCLVVSSPSDLAAHNLSMKEHMSNIPCY